MSMNICPNDVVHDLIHKICPSVFVHATTNLFQAAISLTDHCPFVSKPSAV